MNPARSPVQEHTSVFMHAWPRNARVRRHAGSIFNFWEHSWTKLSKCLTLLFFSILCGGNYWSCYFWRAIEQPFLFVGKKIQFKTDSITRGKKTLCSISMGEFRGADDTGWWASRQIQWIFHLDSTSLLACFFPKFELLIMQSWIASFSSSHRLLYQMEVWSFD